MTDMPQQDVATAFLTLVARGAVREAFERHVAPGFRHHVPDVAEGAAELMDAMARASAQRQRR
jgi:hypothetical protein